MGFAIIATDLTTAEAGFSVAGAEYRNRRGDDKRGESANVLYTAMQRKAWGLLEQLGIPGLTSSPTTRPRTSSLREEQHPHT